MVDRVTRVEGDCYYGAGFSGHGSPNKCWALKQLLEGPSMPPLTGGFETAAQMRDQVDRCLVKHRITALLETERLVRKQG